MERPPMAISPTRAFALGACSIFLVAGVFVAGIAIGARSDDSTSNAAADPIAARIECPSSPGFTATKAANERVSNCEDAAEIQLLLLATGATAANVSVNRRETRSLLGPESVPVVVAQVFLPDDLVDMWDATAAARAISRQVGTTTGNVVITDADLKTLFDGSMPRRTGAEPVDRPRAR